MAQALLSHPRLILYRFCHLFIDQHKPELEAASASGGPIILPNLPHSIPLEAVAAGVVMATWPHFGDQILNEQLVVEVLEIGVAVGVDEPTLFGRGDGDEVEVKVRREEVEKVVGRLMGEGEEGEGRRKRARELKEKARMAMEEGGSSWKGLQDVLIYASESRGVH